MLRHRAGQVFIEYIMIVILVCLAILVGGPVLKRSLFGAFKLQEDSVMDSFSEQMRQATATTNPTRTCVCDPWTYPGCGVGGCAPTQMSSTRPCTPIDCDTENRCTGNVTCCTTVGVQQISCGSLVNGSGENADVPASPTRGAVSSYFLGLGSFDGTIYIGSRDTHDCLIGEMIVSRTCGVAPVVGDPEDPTQKGKSTQVFACQNSTQNAAAADCRPACWGTVEPFSDPCNNPATTDEYDRSSNNLNDEVSYRKKFGVISGGVLTKDNPTRRIFTANNSTSLNPAYILSPPYMGVDSNIYLGAQLMPWTYFLRPASGSSPECSTTRKCERMCATDTLPSENREFCIQPKCDTIVDRDSYPALAVNGKITFLTQQISAPANFLASVSSYNLNFVMGCFDAKGNLMPSAGGANQGQIHLAPYASCTSAPINVSGQTYCVQDTAISNPVLSTTSAVCTGASQVLVRLNNPSPTAAPADIMSYTITYQKQYTGATVELLADNYVDVYASNPVTWTKDTLLYSTPRFTPPVTPTNLTRAWQFPAEFYAEASGGGRIYLIVDHTNEPTETGNNPGGISLQKKGYAVGLGCFTEDTSAAGYTPFDTGSGALPIPATAPWTDSLTANCWIWSTLGTGLNTTGTVHSVHVVADLDGSGACGSCPGGCPGGQYCVGGACVCACASSDTVACGTAYTDSCANACGVGSYCGSGTCTHGIFQSNVVLGTWPGFNCATASGDTCDGNTCSWPSIYACTAADAAAHRVCVDVWGYNGWDQSVRVTCTDYQCM